MHNDTGVYSILGKSWVYLLLQKILGAKNAQKRLIDDFIRPYPGCRILDIGCGPAEILEELGDEVTYYGFDANPEYISEAQKKYGQRGTFFCRRVNESEANDLGQFDIVLVCAVLHHLEDDEIAALITIVKKNLKPGGRLITLDCCFTERQNPVAKFLISHDRGRSTRTPEGYRRLLEEHFHIEGTLTNLLRVPYDHWIMECTLK